MESLKTKFRLLLIMLAAVVALGACSDDKEDASEYHDWKSRNDAYFASIRAVALDTINQAKRAYGNEWEEHCNWRSFLSYRLEENASHVATDSFYVQILKSGTGSKVSPLSSDSCRVFYRGRLIPSESYTDGYVFSYSGQSSIYADIFNRDIAVPTLRTASSFVTGFSTALQYMHVGDRWRLYLPYTLAYDNKAQASIPAYSDLIFEVELVAFYRKGTRVPAWN